MTPAFPTSTPAYQDVVTRWVLRTVKQDPRFVIGPPTILIGAVSVD
jgi:hypothetical protein